MTKPFDTGLVWFRRDLRTDDNPALYLALQQCRKVHCAFVFDSDILAPLPRADRRVAFIQASLVELDSGLREMAHKPHAGLIVVHGRAVERIPALARELGASAVFAAHDYEPSAMARDAKVLGALADTGVVLRSVKDHVIFEQRELLTGARAPYTVFTPYKRAWLRRLQEMPLRDHDPRPLADGLAACPAPWRRDVPALQDIGFASLPSEALRIPPGMQGARRLFEDFFERMDQYHETRDFPALKGPSYLGMHLRFGTVSIRKLVATAMQRSLQGSPGASTWLSELAWRDFYFQILANFPHVAERAFKPAYDAIAWERGAVAEAHFKAWCEGRTGYPLVDAAMLQLNQSGYMHNRLRMVAGSFLVKDLGIDWRRGEAYFAEKLNDYELASNNGGWQWVASSGCDAQPWFRIFNPVTQSRKFDPQGRFIRRYLPQLAALSDKSIHAPWEAKPEELGRAGLVLGKDYPSPVVSHELAREKTLLRYAVVRKG